MKRQHRRNIGIPAKIAGDCATVVLLLVTRRKAYFGIYGFGVAARTPRKAAYRHQA
jgi:hypothetical protein